MVEVVRDARESSSLLENTIPHGGHGTGGTGHVAGDGSRGGGRGTGHGTQRVVE